VPNVAGIKKPEINKPQVKTNPENKQQVPVAEEINPDKVAITPVNEKPGLHKQNISVKNKKEHKEIIKPEEERILVVKDPAKKESNNLPEPAPGIKTSLVNTPVNTENKSEYSVPSTKLNVTERPVGAYYIADASENKTKRLRGFLRKATRILERRANISATDEDDRLLIGGLAVKL
jgi:hypothetical protein